MPGCIGDFVTGINVIGTMKETCSTKECMRIRPKDCKNWQRKEFDLDPVETPYLPKKERP